MIPEMDSQSAAWIGHSPPPLPLTALKGGHIVDPNGWTVAKCYGDYSEEYARLIVAAVNSHAALLAAATWALRQARGMRLVGTIEAIQSAIAAAEESAP